MTTVASIKNDSKFWWIEVEAADFLLFGFLLSHREATLGSGNLQSRPVRHPDERRVWERIPRYPFLLDPELLKL